MSSLFTVGLPGQDKRISCRWGSHISLIAVLALVFIIPHDPSTHLNPWKVGGDAMKVGMDMPASLLPRSRRHRVPLVKSRLEVCSFCRRIRSLNSSVELETSHFASGMH